jgi:hypothetical protein
MNSLILISPYKGSGFKPILSGKKSHNPLALLFMSVTNIYSYNL